MAKSVLSKRQISGQSRPDLRLPPPRERRTSTVYSTFDRLDGRHPWQTQVPEGCILYPVRVLPHGKVSYFNWKLAKEMGLISGDHPHQMNADLENKLLETFCLRIVNEWDQQNGVQFPKGSLKANRYMATRYLQLQHPDKAGRTSGDGRGIWNGIVEHQGRVWDVSSRGTGVTALAPGVVQAGRPLRSGNTDHGYGCGMAEIDELYGAAIMAEIFHQNGVPTERVLTIIDLGKGMGIGVRVGLNLLRPAHLFGHLRQGQYDRLKRAVDYLIDRQYRNGEWQISPQSRRRYSLLLNELCDGFARFMAHLDREYIFAWLDWDGDNALAAGGIIDYGSVRQFGLRHDQYRYDDVERFSTNLTEQRLKARLVVQTYAQMTDFLSTGKKKAIANFSQHPILRRFDRAFEHHLLDHFLYQMGFDSQDRHHLLTKHAASVKGFFKVFSYFERKKTHQKIKKVPDGVNRPAIYNMRRVLAKLPEILLNAAREGNHFDNLDAQVFLGLLLSQNAAPRDRRLTPFLIKKIEEFQRRYRTLISLRARGQSTAKVLAQLAERSRCINQSERLTGNALIHVVDVLLEARKKGLGDEAIQSVMEQLISDQILSPSLRQPSISHTPHGPEHELFANVLSLVRSHKESI